MKLIYQPVPVLLLIMAIALLEASSGIGFIGIIGKVIKNTNQIVRWFSDSSYWIYLMHLPVVTLVVFWMAHLDGSGTVRSLTGFALNPGIKFLISCVVPLAVGIITYQYLVRYTLIGALLNGAKKRRNDLA